MGGSNYHEKFDQVQSTIANYAFNLKLACDPQFKRQEYVKKLSKMIDKKMEKKKLPIFGVVLCDYIQNTIQNEFKDPQKARMLLEKLQDLKNDLNFQAGNMVLQDVVRTYKAMEYSKKEVMRGIEVVVRNVDIMELASENREIKEYFKGLYANPQKLLKNIKRRYKDIKPISKALK